MIYFNTIPCLKFIVVIKVLNICRTLIRADSYVSRSKSVGQICWSVNECEMYSHCLKADPNQKHGTCQCLPGYIKTDNWMQCVQPKSYNQPCEYSEQCKYFDNNTICDTELGHFILKCLCDDHYEYSSTLMMCEPCNQFRCKRPSSKFISESSYGTRNRYDRWYHNVDMRSIGIWSSLLIMALPVSLFLFVLGVRYTRHFFGFTDSSLDPTNQSIAIGLRNEVELRVSVPSEAMLRLELPPSYEDCTKSNRLPSYEEAVLMPNQ